MDYRGHVAPRIGVLKFSHVLSTPRPQTSTTRLLSKTIGTRVYNLHIYHAQQQELDPVRIFHASVSPVLSDGLTVHKEMVKRTLTLAKYSSYKIRFLAILAN